MTRIYFAVLLPFALSHFVSYLFRNVNTVIYPELVRDVGLSPAGLGLLTGAYMATFALAQLPVGMALDRFGPRRVQLPLLVMAALGGLLFAMAQSFTGLLLARGLIGLGVAACLMAAIKASSLWLPPQRLALSTSLLLAVGGLGAVAATAPMQWVVDLVGWRWSFVGLAGAALAAALLIASVVPERANTTPPPRLGAMLASVGSLYANRLFWRLVLCTLFANGMNMAVQGLWLAPWLRDVGHLDRGATAQVLLWSALAMVAGSVCWGSVADRLQRHGVQPLLVCGGGMTVSLLCQGLMLWPQSPLSASVLAMLLVFFGSASALNYAIVAQTMPLHLTGRVSTSFNLLIFLTAFALQWGLGAIIGLWEPEAGTGHYPEAAYHAAWTLGLVLQFPGWLLWLGFRPWRRGQPLVG